MKINKVKVFQLGSKGDFIRKLRPNKKHFNKFASSSSPFDSSEALCERFSPLVKTEGSEIINYSAPLVPPFVSDDETRFMGMTVAVANKIIIKSIPGHMETC